MEPRGPNAGLVGADDVRFRIITDEKDPTGSHVQLPGGSQKVLGLWLATALLAYEERQYGARKREFRRLYPERFNDKWAFLLEEIDSSCRRRWQYFVPTEHEVWTAMLAVSRL